MAGAATALTGQLLVAPGGSGAAAGAVVTGAVTTAVVTRAARHRGVAAVVLAVVAGAVPGAGSPSRAAAVLPWLAGMLVFASFTGRCADDLGPPLQRLATHLRGRGRAPRVVEPVARVANR